MDAYYVKQFRELRKILKLHVRASGKVFCNGAIFALGLEENCGKSIPESSTVYRCDLPIKKSEIESDEIDKIHRRGATSRTPIPGKRSLAKEY